MKDDVEGKPSTGQLFLTVNDDHLADNSGEYRATITVRE